MLIRQFELCRNHRGLRHYWGLRVRGQHTKTTGRRGKTVGVSKKRWSVSVFVCRREIIRERKFKLRLDMFAMIYVCYFLLQNFVVSMTWCWVTWFYKLPRCLIGLLKLFMCFLLVSFWKEIIEVYYIQMHFLISL